MKLSNIRGIIYSRRKHLANNMMQKKCIIDCQIVGLFKEPYHYDNKKNYCRGNDMVNSPEKQVQKCSISDESGRLARSLKQWLIN